MTREELIEYMWNYYEFVSRLYPDGTGKNLMDETVFSEALNAALDAKRDELEQYCVHGNECPLSMWSEGRPAADGGYEMAYGYGADKKWYPKGEYPPCTCGLLRALDEEEEATP